MGVATRIGGEHESVGLAVWDGFSAVSTHIPDDLAAPSRRVLLVSNRLPFSAIDTEDGPELRRSSGGLVTALERVHDRTNTLWIGNPGSDALRNPGDVERLQRGRMVPVPLSEMESTGFYRCYANGILWPTLHGMTPPSTRDRCGWGMYRAANERFADVVATHWRDGDRIWVHDYQLMLLPSLLRERLPDARIGFFLHTPLPAPRELALLAEWNELSRGLLGADLVGFQTRRDAQHFLASVGVRCAGGKDEIGIVAVGEREARVSVYPIGIDSDAIEAQTRHPAVVARRAALHLDSPGPLFVGVDRLDYTKGIPERLLAFERLLLDTPELRGRARFMQVAVPSRDDVSGYAELRVRVEAIVARINSRFGTDDWRPVTYIHGSVDPDTLIALYGAADVMVVTPKRDGMNLVAKEFVAARTDGGGVLVLGREAGAAAELRGAILVDGGDVASILDGYRRALEMKPGEARPRMRAMRAVVSSGDVYAWADRFLGAVPASATPGGPMTTPTNASTSIDREDLDAVASLATMRFHLRAKELKRATRVRDVVGAAAELSKALTRYVHSAGIIAETPRLGRELVPDTSAVYDALVEFASFIRATANEFRAVVTEPQALPADVPGVGTSNA